MQVVLSDEQMGHGGPFSRLNDEQISNKVGVEHQPDMSEIPSSSSERFVVFWGDILFCC